MMKTKSHSISGAFVFMLLGVFAVFSMLLVVLGAQAYRTTVDGAAAHTQKRIVTAFVRNAVRAQDERGAITVEEHDGSACARPFQRAGRRTLCAVYLQLWRQSLRTVYLGEIWFFAGGRRGGLRRAAF